MKDTSTTNAASPLGDLPRFEDLSTYFLAFLYPGPAYDGFPPKTPEQAAIQQAHMAYVWRIQQPGGPAIAGGPVVSEGVAAGSEAPPVGMSILRCKSQAEAERVAASDPGVAAGRFRAIVYRWLVPAGRLPV